MRKNAFFIETLRNFGKTSIKNRSKIEKSTILDENCKNGYPMKLDNLHLYRKLRISIFIENQENCETFHNFPENG